MWERCSAVEGSKRICRALGNRKVASPTQVEETEGKSPSGWTEGVVLEVMSSHTAKECLLQRHFVKHTSENNTFKIQI